MTGAQARAIGRADKELAVLAPCAARDELATRLDPTRFSLCSQPQPAGPEYSRRGFWVRQESLCGAVFPPTAGNPGLAIDRTARRSPRALPLQQRELELRRDIAEACFNARTPIEVYRLALVRVTPQVKASFASVFLRDKAEPDLLRLVCAQNWPQPSARHLGQLRIRVGRGPTGRAVGERAIVETGDLFADASLEEWWQPARELGIAAQISVPLQVGDAVVGALSFYYANAHEFTADDRQLIQIIADELSLTAARADQAEQLRQTGDELRQQVASLAAQLDAANRLQRLHDELRSDLGNELCTPLNSILGHTRLLLEQPSLNTDQLDALHEIERVTGELLSRINHLLELAQPKPASQIP